MTIFNGSHYEDVLVQRVHDMVPKEVWSKRYEHINNFEEIVLERNARIRSVRAVTGKKTVPQVFIDGEYIGGSEDLVAYLQGDDRAAA